MPLAAYCWLAEMAAALSGAVTAKTGAQVLNYNNALRDIAFSLCFEKLGIAEPRA